MLVGSQVALSIILPTVIFPLVLLCSKEEVMTVEGLDPVVPHRPDSPTIEAVNEDEITPVNPVVAAAQQVDQTPNRPKKSYKSPLWITILGFVLFSVVVVANAYVIVQLALGNA